MSRPAPTPLVSTRELASFLRAPAGVHRSSPAQWNEGESLFTTYEHLSGLPRGDAALTMLRRVASVVKPIMRKHGWRVRVLSEFLPPQPNLLGLNINNGYKICIRLRYQQSPDLFLPWDQVVDTMLHELCHNVWSDHDSRFHRLWDQLRDEYQTLQRKGYTGEGFLSPGNRLGCTESDPALPPHEIRRLARVRAEKRRTSAIPSQSSEQKVGDPPLHLPGQIGSGTPIHRIGRDVRQIIADQVVRRNAINRGCACGRQDAEKLSDKATFATKAEEDDANDRAIARALFELMAEEEAAEEEAKEQRKLSRREPDKGRSRGLAWSSEGGLYYADRVMPIPRAGKRAPSEEEQLEWAIQASLQPTCIESPFRRTAGMAGEGAFEGRTLVGRGGEPPPLPPPALAKIMISQGGDQWTCETCTCINPVPYLVCDACGIERPHQAMLSDAEQVAGKGTQARSIQRKTVPSTSQPRSR